MWVKQGDKCTRYETRYHGPKKKGETQEARRHQSVSHPVSTGTSLAGCCDASISVCLARQESLCRYLHTNNWKLAQTDHIYGDEKRVIINYAMRNQKRQSRSATQQRFMSSKAELLAM
ncbi:hypothetical protein FVEG_14808 [Fusarium verticillioides 7600]|uniref:Uncharacterized protein n=1 Tax=Gibberella moniliformis (strain M3125 / FGSC 7600) TaxID=334819 RepID=W7LZ92_GIBM7|nr:hypothetical protein FVEG_14808 [Fusarium verticillioides 7600]EWG37902.1 hypothetical protein FVEG_14808 [Fusarium verticillioides 7600]